MICTHSTQGPTTLVSVVMYSDPDVTLVMPTTGTVHTCSGSYVCVCWGRGVHTCSGSYVCVCWGRGYTHAVVVLCVCVGGGEYTHAVVVLCVCVGGGGTHMQW